MSQTQPLVSVIVMCYQHGAYVQEAIESVLTQDYAAIELIVSDDGSTDESQQVIKALARQHPQIKTVLHAQNQGYTRSFNQAWRQSQGEYIIDLAADDVLLPGRVQAQVKYFLQQSAQTGVIYTDAHYINARGAYLHAHFGPAPAKVADEEPPSGDLYARLLFGYLIAAPTMMIRREVLEQLGGYDESLSYEDFDFWIRSARDWHYAYLPQVTTHIRLLTGSLSSQQYRPGSKQLEDTFAICQKAAALNRSEAEHRALVNRLRYEHRHARWCGHDAVALRYWQLMKSNRARNLLSYLAHYLGPVLRPRQKK